MASPSTLNNMREFTIETYLRLSLSYTVMLWAAYAVYLVLCWSFKKTRLRSFRVALVCFLLLSEEFMRVSLMLNGVLAAGIKPYWVTLLMNIPFIVIIYEILFRKVWVAVARRWAGNHVRRRLSSHNEPGRMHSAVKRLGRSASDRLWSD